MKTLDHDRHYHYCALNQTKTGTSYTDGMMHSNIDPSDPDFMPKMRVFIAKQCPGKIAANKVAILSLTLIDAPAGAGSGSAPMGLTA